MYNNDTNDEQFNMFFQQVRNAALSNAEFIVTSRLPDGKRKGNEWVALNPKRPDQSLGSFSINLTTGAWSDFATDDKGGDIISLVAYLDDCKQFEAAKSLANTLGINFDANTYVQKTVHKKTSWKPIVPVPPDVSAPDLNGYAHVATYTDEHGAVCCYISRVNRTEIDAETGKCKKDFYPKTYGSIDGQPSRWHSKHIPDNRPLYRLQELVANSNKPILITEGEKKADRAVTLVGDRFCITTTIGGAEAADKTNFKLLNNRDILIWPDNDPSGMQTYAQAVARHALDVGAKSVRIVQVPSSFPPKWDLGDDFPTGITLDDINKLLDAAPLFQLNPEENSTPQNQTTIQRGKFQLTPTHLKVWIEKKDADDSKMKGSWRTVCSRIDVLGIVRTISHGGWGLYLRWKDRDGHPHTWTLGLGAFQKREKSPIKEYLVEEGGLEIKQHMGVHLIEYLERESLRDQKKIVSSSKVGFMPDFNAFVLPNKTIGDETYIFQNEKIDHKYGESGTLEEWNEHLAQYGKGNDLLFFGLCASIASPMIEILDEESVIFHFRCQSSRGKSTISQCAVSTWGHGKHYQKAWNATAGALEMVAQVHNNTFLNLEELQTADADSVGKVVYNLCNGSVKERLNQNSSLKKNAKFAFYGISTGEISLKDKIKQSKYNQKIYAGQEVRFIDIPADFGGALGVFQNIYHFEDARQFADHLKEASTKYYGTAKYKFLEKLLERLKDPDFVNLSKFFIDQFIKSLDIPQNADPQIGRVAKKFAVCALAGELGIEFEVFKWLTKNSKDEWIDVWQRGDAIRCARRCFEVWKNSRDGAADESFDEIEIIESVRLFFEMYGKSRFTKKDESFDSSNNVTRAGFREMEGGDLRLYVLPSVFTHEICKGLNSKLVIEVLKKRGILEPDPKTKKNQQTVWVSDLGKSTKLYVINWKIFEGATDDPDNSNNTTIQKDVGAFSIVSTNIN